MSIPGESSVKLSKPFSSDTSEEKEDLLREAGAYREKLEGQWEDLKFNATEYGKNALIISGVVTASYLLTRVILPKEKKTKVKVAEPEKLVVNDQVYKKKSSFAVGDAVQSLVWTLAVGWARKKLQHFIEEEREPDEKQQS